MAAGPAVSASRERDVAASFVDLATGLAAGVDVVDLLAQLTADCARLLGVHSAGLLLADGFGRLHVMAASSEGTRDLELFQVQREQGPCLDCFSSGRPVSVPDLRAARQRWPVFATAAGERGFASVHALPMRLRQRTLGALGLFGTTPGSLAGGDASLGQALADVASVAIVQNARAPQSDAVDDAVAINAQMQAALASRMVVEQAKGVLAHSGKLSMDAALQVLRAYAAAHGRRLTEVAADVVHRRLPARTVLVHREPPAAGDATAVT